jgi:hypothetical protein
MGKNDSLRFAVASIAFALLVAVAATVIYSGAL